MNKQKLIELLENPEKLPAFAYTILPTDPTEVISVTNGESGYNVYFKAPTADLAWRLCDHRNKILGVTEEAREALAILSMKK